MNPAPRAPVRLLGGLAFAFAMTLATPSLAGPGHEGGHEEETAPVTGGPTVPRFETHSDLFELVATLRGNDLVLTLDRYASNEPVANAQIELESGSYKAVGTYQPESASYRFAAPPFAAPGTYPVTMTVTAGEDIDLLAADLVVPTVATAPTDASASTATPTTLLWGAAGVGAALVLALALRRRRAA